MTPRDNRRSRAAGDLRRLLAYRSVSAVGDWSFARALAPYVPEYRQIGNYGLQDQGLYELLFFSAAVPRATCLQQVTLYRDAVQAWWCFGVFDD